MLKTSATNNNSLVSIIVPSYNQANFLSETLDSVLKQDYQNWECIIIDDGSTDNTKEIAQKYCNKDKRFKYIKQKNQGPSVARNRGIKISNGEFILPLDSDDLISNNYIKEAVNVFLKKPETKLVYCQAELFGESSGKWQLQEYSYSKLLFENMIFCTAMYRKSDFEKTNGYNPNMDKGWEDWDFWLSLIKRDDLVFMIPKVLFYYRIKKKSRNSNFGENNKKTKETYSQIFLNHKDLYEVNDNPLYVNYLLNKKEQEVQQKDQEILAIKSSKTWKLLNFYLKIRNYLTSVFFSKSIK